MLSYHPNCYTPMMPPSNKPWLSFNINKQESLGILFSAVTGSVDKMQITDVDDSAKEFYDGTNLADPSGSRTIANVETFAVVS